MTRTQVWTGRPLLPEALAVLDGLATISVSRPGEQADWLAEAAGSDAVVAGAEFFTEEALERLGPRLRVVARTGIGVDRIDLAAATRRGILITNTPDGPTESTAEHAIALMLGLCKHVMAGDRILRAGNSFPVWGELRPGFELAGAVLGLVGLGRIGSRVAEIARVLGMQVIAYDPFASPERAGALHVELVSSLEELLPRARVLSLHCPLLPETRKLINADRLRLLPRGSYLINVARGGLIDEAALLDALRSGHLAGVALDVFDPEPPAADHPFFTLPNTICTPHIGSFTGAGLQRMQVMACEQIAQVLRGERPTNLVNIEVWDQPHR
jgi:D-3-phosphoglycerate dehydrogenase